MYSQRIFPCILHLLLDLALSFNGIYKSRGLTKCHSRLTVLSTRKRNNGIALLQHHGITRAAQVTLRRMLVPLKHTETIA
jgi:hypothetical protein